MSDRGIEAGNVAGDLHQLENIRALHTALTGDVLDRGVLGTFILKPVLGIEDLDEVSGLVHRKPDHP